MDRPNAAAKEIAWRHSASVQRLQLHLPGVVQQAGAQAHLDQIDNVTGCYEYTNCASFSHSLILVESIG